MDPLTITTTIVTFASFINELIEVGESIRRSIEKVNENRRQIRELTDDVVRVLYDLAKLTQCHEDTFRVPELLSALESLKAEMLYVHSKCLKLSSVQLPGLRGVRSQFKAWRKRDDLEEKIGRLKEHVSKCYCQFTAFSAARIERNTSRIEQSAARNEQNTLRIEQTLIVNNVENQVKARRLEGMMAQVLLETQFGQNVMNRTVEIISADPTHSSLESQYMSAQTMCLIALLEGLLISGKFVLDGPIFDPAIPFAFGPSTGGTSLHLLHEILGAVINIEESRDIGTLLGSMKSILLNLLPSLVNIGLVSESIAWGRVKIRMLHTLDAVMALPDMAHALTGLSIAYQRQHQFQSSIQASQQSLDLWHHLSDSFPEVDIRIYLIMVLTTQARSLLRTGQRIAALSTAQDAVALSRPMLEQIIDSSSGFLSSVDELNADWSCEAIFELAKVLSSLDRHIESYEASKEGFQTIIKLPVVSPHLLWGEDIDSFLDQICKVAEGGGFSLAMLVDCVILLRNLARIYPEQFSRQFIWILHAYAYFAQQDDSPLIENIRLFLEPNSDHLPPRLDSTKSMDLDLLGHGGIQIEEVVRAFYTHLAFPSEHLIQNIIITHFDDAFVGLRDVVEESTSNPTTNEWILWTITRVILFLSTPNQLALLQVAARTIKHFRLILAHWSEWEWVLDHLLGPIFTHFWRAGLLDDALKICEQVIKFLDSHRHSDNTIVVTEWQLTRHFILCDMGRLFDVIGMIQQTTIASVPERFFLHSYIVQIRILRRTGRNQEAFQLLRKGVAAGCQKYWTDSVEVFHSRLYFLLAESAAVCGNVGNRERALKHVERAVAACRRDMGLDEDIEGQKCALSHSLVTLSNCLATLGRKDNALAAAQEAVLVYTENVPHMWGSFLYTLRKQELRGNAFHALSLRLVTSGMAEQALLNAEKATELYRELVVLAPRHLPTLASSLQNLSSILWDVGRRDEAIAACEEAVGSMRRVSSPETYFLPALAEALDQLAAYLREKGNVVGASAAAAECAQVRREFAALPPGPEFLFEEVVDMVESDDEEEWWAEADEYHDASEGPSADVVESDDEVDEYHDASELPTSVESLAFILEPSSRSSTLTPGPSTDIDASVQPKPCGISIAAENSDIVVFNGSSAVESVTTTDTVQSILSKPLEVEVKLSMRMRSTLMDIVWWVLLLVLGISFAIVWRRVV